MKRFISILVLLIALAINTTAQNGSNTNPVEEKTPTIEKNEKDLIFQKVEVEAEFPGGAKEWKRFLEKKLNGNIPKENNAPKGVYTVIVSFLIELDGTITDIKAQTNIGFGTEAEVIKIMKKSPKWKPAMQNGLPVKFIKRQPVSFVVM